MSSLLLLISAAWISLCHQQQLPEQDVHPALQIPSSRHLHPVPTRTLAPAPGGWNKFKCHFLLGAEGAHRSLGKVVVTFLLSQFHSVLVFELTHMVLWFVLPAIA